MFWVMLKLLAWVNLDIFTLISKNDGKTKWDTLAGVIATHMKKRAMSMKFQEPLLLLDFKEVRKFTELYLVAKIFIEK